MTPAERKSLSDTITAQIGMLAASVACDPKVDGHVVASARGILDASRELNRALARLATEPSK